MTAWKVITEWRALPGPDWVPNETCQEHPDWPTARRDGRQMSCLSGVRYVTVLDPDSIVAADYTRYTNHWREYALHVGPCGNYLELEDRPCPGQMYARATDLQVRCPLCRGWSGTRSGHGLRLPFDPCPPEPKAS